MNNKEIEQVKSARYLGVIFDDEMSFKEQFLKVKSKLIQGVKALICTRFTLNFRAKIMLYNANFKSHVEYCSIIFFDKLSKKQINELYILQKQAIRLIFNARKFVHTEKLFKLAGIEPITKLYNKECIKMVFKNKFDPMSINQPTAIRELFMTKENNRARLYKNMNKIKIPSYYKKENCLYNIIDNWNSSDPEIKDSGNLWILKKKLKQCYLNSLPICDHINCKTCQLDENKDYEKYMST